MEKGYPFRDFFRDTLNERWVRMYDGQNSRGLKTIGVKNVPEDVTDEAVLKKLNGADWDIPLHADPANTSQAVESGWIEWDELNKDTNKTYAVLANENWENGHILTTVENFPPYNGYLIVDGITEEELENDDDVTEYVEVEVIDPGKGKKTDYYPPEDKHGYAIRF